MAGSVEDVTDSFPASLATIGAASTRWPPLETLQWQALREVVADCRDAVAGVGETIDATNADGDLTDAAKARRIAAAGLAAIERLNALPSLARAERLVTDFLSGLRERRAVAIQAPATANDAAIASEIRDWLAAQDSPFSAAKNKLSDPRVASAVLTAPAFLSGVSDSEHALLRQAAEEQIDPQAASTAKQNETALEEARATVRAARERIGKLCQLRKTMNGAFERQGLAAADKAA